MARKTFPTIETKKLKQLYNAHRSIQALCVLWILGAFFLLIILAITITSQTDTLVTKTVVSAVLVVLISLYVVTIVGVYKRKKWSRYLGLALCIIALAGVPIGTLIGILGLFAFGRARELFEPERLDPDELIVEYKKRKQQQG